MYQISKASQTSSAAASEADLQAINQLSRRELTAEEVYVLVIRACDDQPDRDNERFTVDCLKGLAQLFVDKPVLFDHRWSARQQTARIFAASVVAEGGENYLQLRAYMIVNTQTQPIIDAIDGGILKEVSVGCSVRTATCSICGESYYECDHYRGHEYSGKTCIVQLSNPVDAYEVSFVAVPAQPKAGIQKSAEPEGMSIIDVDRAKAQIAIERIRFGGSK